MTWWRRLARVLLYGRNPDFAGKARVRVVLLMGCFALVYAVIAGRVIMLAAQSGSGNTASRSVDATALSRPDLVDRNGEILATDVKLPSLFAEPKRIIDVDEAVEQLTAVLPDLDPVETRERLSSKKGFAWLRREITPQQMAQIHRLGIPGIGFLKENKRVYPNGNTVSHLIGHVNVDNQGIAGLEKWLDSRGLADLHMAGFAVDRLQKPVELAVDLRVQHVIRDELIAAREKFKAKAAAGLLIDVRTGEIVSMVSVPDYDPNNPKEANDPDRINRLTTGVYEMGSTFKALTVAMALDAGRFNLNSMWDARSSLRYGSFSIDDFHAQRRVLNTAEVFTYSSNIGTARMALSLGVDHHREFLRRLGQLDRLTTELPESAAPIVPRRWGELNTVTISFGHGIAVAPLQSLAAVGALMNGGYWIPPTFIKRSEAEARRVAVRVVKPETSERMRYVMRLNAEKGTAGRSEVRGFYVGGKTGTSEKVVNGRYSKTQLLTTFMAVFPSDKPQYLLLVMLDEPKGLPETHGFATAGWNAAPTSGRIIARIGSMLRIEPRLDLPPAEQLILARGRP
jgi:cell division protein FtsI (penicillin-binding protein 3)